MKANKFLSNERGEMGEISNSVVGLLIIVVVGMITAFIGSELDSAMNLGYDASDPGNNTVWANITGKTGETGEDGMNIVKVGVILVIILASVGVFIYPTLERIAR